MRKFKVGDVVKFNLKQWNKDLGTGSRDVDFSVEVLSHTSDHSFKGKVVESNQSNSNDVGNINTYLSKYFDKTFTRDKRGRFSDGLTVLAQEFNAARNKSIAEGDAYLDTCKGSLAVKVFMKAMCLQLKEKL